MKNVMFSFKSFTASFLFLRSSRSKALRYGTAILVLNIPRYLASWFHPSPLSRFDTHSQAILGSFESKMAACNENARGLAQISMVTGHQYGNYCTKPSWPTAPAGTVFDVCERLVPLGAVSFSFSDSFSWRHGKLSGIVWTATAPCRPVRLAERLWFTKFHSLRECIDHC